MPGDAAPQACLAKVFFEPLPGKTDYCLGLRDWRNGHYHSGLEFLTLAAGWGNKRAQYTLGLIHYNGHHVAPDPALGIAWLMLADERHNDLQASLAVRSARQWATPDERARAGVLFERMRKVYGDRVAARRAWRRLKRWQSGHGQLLRGCVLLRGAQGFAALQSGLGEPTWDSGVCVPVQKQRHLVQASSDAYFEGLFGSVTVGPLQPVPAPAASSAR